KEEHYGKEAQVYTCNRLKSAQNLTVEWDNTQEASHERQIAIVFIDGKNYNLELFQEGYSNDRYLKNKMPYAEQYRKAMQEAQRDKKGMWTK
ncbi:MAG: thermonuclease family protein, partial [Culicoidibacterales bacterium]